MFLVDTRVAKARDIGDQAEKAGFKSFSTVARTIQHHYQTILNFFDNRSTNVSAESSMPKSKPS